MPYKDKARRKEYQRLWYQRKRKGLSTKTKIVLTKEQSKKRELERNRKYQKQIKELKKEYIGNKCIICGYEKRLICHKKDGEDHPKLSRMGRKALEEYLKKHHDEFACLCFKCHKHVHWVMEYFKMTWDDISRHCPPQDFYISSLYLK